MPSNVARITAIVPQLVVDDLERAIEYYRERLGFDLDFVYESCGNWISRDRRDPLHEMNP